jgi:hypothetical protein
MSPCSPSCVLRLCMVSCVGVFLCFCYYFICCGSTSALLNAHDWYAVVYMAPLVTGPSGITSPHGTVNRTRTCSALSSSSDWAPDVSVYCQFHHDRACSIAHWEAAVLDLFLVLCKFFDSEEHGAVVVFTAIGLGPLVTV